jgi:hypothetical protein
MGEFGVPSREEEAAMELAKSCIEYGEDCEGDVEVRMLPDNPRSFPRCEFHFEKRLAKSEHNLELMSPARPAWFDESYAGERWDEDE